MNMNNFLRDIMLIAVIIVLCYIIYHWFKFAIYIMFLSVIIAFAFRVLIFVFSKFQKKEINHTH